MKNQIYTVIDYETRSRAALADKNGVGAYEYARHESTEIMWIAWRTGTKEQLRKQLENKIPARKWSPLITGKNSIKEFLTVLKDADIKLVAHNAFFEQMITRFKLSRHVGDLNFLTCIPHSRWICTASMCRAIARPGKLEEACIALKLPIKKDMEGHRLMLKMCKPQKATKKKEAGFNNEIENITRLGEYCCSDVDAETMILLNVPELTPLQRRMWLLDQKINYRGFEVDRELVRKCLKMIAEETKNLDKEVNKITNGKLTSANQVAGLSKILHEKGLFLPNLQAKTVEDALASGIPSGPVKRLLEIRQAISKTSTAKYAAFWNRSTSDGRCRDNLLWHQATTGRFAGVGVQPHNFPRGTIKDVETAVEVLHECNLEWVRALYGDPMNVFSSCLRPVIKASKGKILRCADYSAIEARVLFWLADHVAGTNAFRDNRPIYEEMAQTVYGLQFLAEVTKQQREVGKRCILGDGYGMGWKKFRETCKKFGTDISDDLAKRAVKAYRSKHKPVVKLWAKYEKAAIAAVQNPTKAFKINHVVWYMKGKDLKCELPSSRCLTFPEPQVKYEKKWDQRRPVLYHWRKNPITKKWEFRSTYGGCLTENICQATAFDLMAAAMIRLEDKGYPVILTVHDEILSECLKNFGTLKEFNDLMAENPEWAAGCPVRVEGWEGPRYKK